ncbi:MAG: IS1595 family transposase [bacterium]|nr:IS1595 family transposase [bacterium]
MSRDYDRAMTRPVKKVNASALKGVIREIVANPPRIITDEWRAYQGIGQYYVSGHSTVNHSQGEYSRGNVHVNHAESFFALLKRGVHGIFHHVSVKHLGCYCHEFNFRWNRRKVTDGERSRDAICRIQGRRLPYANLTAYSLSSIFRSD